MLELSEGLQCGGEWCCGLTTHFLFPTRSAHKHLCQVLLPETPESSRHWRQKGEQLPWLQGLGAAWETLVVTIDLVMGNGGKVSKGGLLGVHLPMNVWERAAVQVLPSFWQIAMPAVQASAQLAASWPQGQR